MKLSVILPSIRVENLERLHSSIDFKGEWEFIVVGPYIPNFMPANMTWIGSKASPTVCQQQGLIVAKGEYVCFAWDDGWFMPEQIDAMFAQLQENKAVSGKYVEGDYSPEYMATYDYYRIKTHDRAASPYLSDDLLLINTGLIPRGTLLEIGGFDCRFESTAISAVDMAIRLQLHGVKVVLSEDIVLKCTWLIGDEGDHAPINSAVEEDFNLLHKKYRQPIFSKRIIIPIDNWKNQPKVWERRFNDTKN